MAKKVLIKRYPNRRLYNTETSSFINLNQIAEVIREGYQVEVQDVKSKGIPIVLISHNMPHIFEVCDRIHIHRLGRRLCTVDPKIISMSDAVAMMTGAMEPPTEALDAR